MSIPRHHTEWMSLVEISGPFLSLPVLLRAFPQGLDEIDPALVQQLRAAYEEWLEDRQHRTHGTATHAAWIMYVLRNVLELPAEVIAEGQAIPDSLKVTLQEHGETIRPSHVLVDPADQKARLLILVYPPGQHLESPVAGKRWKASPMTRMTELLRGTGVRLGLVTNGEQWMLVDAPRDDTTGFASWYAELWLDERLTLRAFRSLLGAFRFFSVAASDTLDALLGESAQSEEDVTDQLGYQVRRAVEVLVSALDRADQDHNRQLLADVPESEIYEAALTVMMRLVFLFCAEERGLLLLGDPMFDQHYAVFPLREQLRQAADQHGEEVLERRHDAWCRLLASFRAVHGGLQHERMTIPPYGGRLFDPDRFPFLEGRAHNTAWRLTNADPLPIDNRTVLHLLEALQLLQVKVPGGGAPEARRLSFRALDIEQIGHVYEGLLDHTAKRATEVTLGLIGTRDKTRDYEPEVPLSELERLAAKSRDALIEFLREATNRSAKAIAKALDRELPVDDYQRLQVACGPAGTAKRLLERVRAFGGLIRLDTIGHPVVIHAGSIYVTEGMDRRATGTQYTPRSLTEPVVQQALEPLVYSGPADGAPRGDWKLRSARDLLSLAVCDLACGSGAFLVQVCRYLGARLLEAWEAIERQQPGQVRITPDGELSTGEPEERLIPNDPDERFTYAMRLIAQSCIYGVDVNHLAVEMAKLSLWLLTLAKERPFTFLDHNIRCGDSLLGLEQIEQLKRFSLDGGPIQRPLSRDLPLDTLIDDAIQTRRQIERIDAETIERVTVQEKLLVTSEHRLARLKIAADELLAADTGLVDRDTAIRRATEALKSENGAPLELSLRMARTPLHWPLEFPEVFARGGFDAFVGNPPFLGGKRISTVLGDVYAATIRQCIVKQKGAGDLCAYFLRRAVALANPMACFGLITTNSISEGDTRELGLSAIVSEGGTIFCAETNTQWPGSAGITVTRLYITKRPWHGNKLLDGTLVAHISPHLDAHEQLPPPVPIPGNVGLASTGTYVNGKGFIVSAAERDELLAADPKNDEVIQPYLTSQDINQRPDGSPSRFVINFRDWPEERAAEYERPFARLVELVKPARDRLTRQVHEKCFWKHWDRRPELYERLAPLSRAIVMGRVSSEHALTFMDPSWLPFDGVVVFLWDDFGHFALLQSSVHETWSRRFRTTLREDPRYSLSDCFVTFPLPSDASLTAAATVGETYFKHRTSLQQRRQIGLTTLYQQFHDANDESSDIGELRRLHEQLDFAVAAAYGWNDLSFTRGFRDVHGETRYVLPDLLVDALLRRLLALNRDVTSVTVSPSRGGRRSKKQSGAAGALF